MSVELDRGGLLIDGELVPLYAGAVHYWRLDPESWRPCLSTLKSLGFRMVETYVPWDVHERAPGELELGANDPQRDVIRFLRIAEELGLWAIVRPGPHVNAELTYFGLPERIVWDPACQARSPHGNPVMLPILPKMFPVPSYASEAYLDEVTRWFHLLGRALAPLCHPHGPIVLVQVDNEGALYFRDGAYDQDYHPDAIAQYRAYLRRKYGTLTRLREAYGATVPAPADPTAAEPELRFTDLDPPRRFDARRPHELVSHLDWVEFQEELIAGALGRFAAALRSAGFVGIPTGHNFPPAQDATPLNAARVCGAVDLVGLDYYGRASAEQRAVIARRTGELAVRCDALSHPAYACEMGAGFPPYFPALSERDNAFVTTAALAYGLRGLNAYMAVDRDRWIGAPIDRHGRERPFAELWRKLWQALELVRFHRLRRKLPVRLVVPRLERRVQRALHAFGPASPALLAVMGFGPREACLEEDFGTGRPLALDAETLARSFERALEARGVPFALVGGEDRDTSLADASWIVCACSGAMSPVLLEALSSARRAGARLTLGPQPPELGPNLLPLPTPVRRLLDGAELIRSTDPRDIDAAVARAITELELPCVAGTPDGVHVTVHEDEQSVVRVAFVINAAQGELVARASLGVDALWRDLLGDTTREPLRSRDGTLELRLRPLSVTMLAREP